MTTAMVFTPYGYDIKPNRYKGYCVCGTFVLAGEGFYNGQTFCTKPGHVGDSAGLCERLAAIEIQKAANPKPVARRELTDAEIKKAQARQAEFARQDAEWSMRGLCRCDRCGGAGGSEAWPVWACYDCGGKGAVAS
jgi:hypothetical protein